ncbi:MAG TPA: tetratricopeptide repeat protein [Candidatus Lokiarchaeia archaeon]|nr:tetratricopeptide repeat protein [Candidatus Lokiarchaeia archaeon]
MVADTDNPDNPPANVEALQAEAAVLEAEGDVEGLCKVLVDLSLALSEQGQAEEAVLTIETCIEKLDQIDNPAATVSALGMLGLFRAAAGRYSESTDAYIIALQEMEEMPPNVEEQIHCLNGIGRNLVALGDWQGAITQFREVEALTRRSVLPQEELDAIASQITLLEDHEDFEAVIPLYERAEALFRLVGDAAGSTVMLRGLAIAYGKTGDREKALEFAQKFEDAQNELKNEPE